MIKISVCSTGFKKKKVDEVFQMAKQYSLDGVDLWSGHIDEFLSRGHGLDELKELLTRNGLEVPCILPYFDFITNKEITERSLGEAQKCVHYAKRLDAPIIRVFTGRKVPSNEMTDIQWEMCFDGLNRLCSIDKDILFGIEMHDKQPADRTETILKMLLKTNCENLRVIFDGLNFEVEGISQMEAIKELYEYVVHVHIKNRLFKQNLPTPIHIGDVDNESLLIYLLERGYKGFISLEYFNENYDELIRESVRYLRRIISN